MYAFTKYADNKNLSYTYAHKESTRSLARLIFKMHKLHTSRNIISLHIGRSLQECHKYQTFIFLLIVDFENKKSY